MKGPIKIWLDDERAAPEGFLHARTVDECISLMQQHRGNIYSISFDWWLGSATEPTGDQALAWLRNAILNEGFPMPTRLRSHTSDRARRFEMYEIIKEMKEFRG